MGNKGPDHEWRGTLVLETSKPLELAVRAYPAFGKPISATYHRVHAEPCQPQVGRKKAEAREEESEEGKGASPADEARGPVQDKPTCSRCGEDLKPHEIAWEAILPRGKPVLLQDRDFEAMQFTKSRTAKVQLVPANDPALTVLGFQRRLYLLPEPVSATDYWAVLAALQETHIVGFVPFISLKSDRAYVGVVRPISIPSELFAEESNQGLPAELLVLDCVGDTNRLKDARMLPGYSGKAAASQEAIARMRVAIKDALWDRVLGEECLDPKTAHVLRAIRLAHRRALESKAR